MREVEGEFLTNKDSDFRRFYDNFAGDRDADSPRDLLLDLYNYAMAKPEYHAWLMQLPEVYETGAEITQSNLWQNQIKPYLLDSFKGLENKINGRLEETIFETKELKKSEKTSVCLIKTYRTSWRPWMRINHMMSKEIYCVCVLLMVDTASRVNGMKIC